MKKITTHTNRDAYISEDFLNYLRDHLYGFADELIPVQMELTRMIKLCGTSIKEHAHHPGWSSFAFENLEAKFGRGKFPDINERLGIFHSEMDWSKIEKRTKPYKLTPHVESLRERFFSNPPTKATNLLAENGDVRHVPPRNAIASQRKTAGGKLVTKQGWTGPPVLSAVPANQERLQCLADLMKTQMDLFKNGQPTDYLIDPKHAGYVLNEIQLILHDANNTVSPGCVIHLYDQSNSGRMYADDVNLQSAQRQVRYAALHGLWDYDIENCHYSILQQMADRAHHDCEAITYYLYKKTKVRHELAEEFGVTVAQVKKVLIALVYGASLSEDKKAAIPDILGSVDTAKALYEHEFFKALAADIAAAQSAILKRTKPFRGGITNMRGLTMKIKGKENSQLLSHLLQGVEAVALDAAHDLYASKIVLLQHDGFTATTPDLDIVAIEQAIFDATKYNLKVAVGKQIQFDLQSALMDTEKVSIQSQNLLEAPIHAGSSHLSAY